MRFISFLLKVYKKLMHKSYSTLAGSIAFFLIINGGSLAYLVMFISKILDYDLHVDNQTINLFLSTVESKIDYSNVFFTIFFIITSVYGASTLFFHLIKVGEIIYEEVNGKFSIIKRLTAIIFLSVVLIIVMLLFLIIVLSENAISNILLRVARILLFLIVPYFIAVCINFFVTPKKVRFKEINKGSMFTTAFWFVVTIAFTVYLKIFTNYKAIYGAMTFFIVFMIWIYLLAQGLVIGIIFNYFEKEKNAKLLHSCKVNNNIGTPKEDNEKD